MQHSFAFAHGVVHESILAGYMCFMTSFQMILALNCLFSPKGVSIMTALYSSAGVDAILMEAISSKLPRG